MTQLSEVWVFNGIRSNFPSGVFTRRDLAEEWIKRHGLEGTLTKYPLDTGVYEWAISNDLFTAKRDEQRSAKFIAQFSSASQEHYHFEA